jgi:hypothetical protein
METLPRQGRVAAGRGALAHLHVEPARAEAVGAEAEVEVDREDSLRHQEIVHGDRASDLRSTRSGVEQTEAEVVRVGRQHATVREASLIREGRADVDRLGRRREARRRQQREQVRVNPESSRH